jgi:hypothetical protein
MPGEYQLLRSFLWSTGFLFRDIGLKRDLIRVPCEDRFEIPAGES